MTQDQMQILLYLLDQLADEAGLMAGTPEDISKIQNRIVEYVNSLLPEPERCGGCGEPKNVGIHGLDQGYGGCV